MYWKSTTSGYHAVMLSSNIELRIGYNYPNRVWEMKGRTDLWKSGDEYFEWWLSREGLEKDTGQASFDDCLVPFSD